MEVSCLDHGVSCPCQLKGIVQTDRASVLIKTATKERKKFLKQEYDSHCRLAISSSPFIRKIYDIVGDVEDFDDRSQNHTPCLVFEWMDQTLADIPVKDHLRNDALQRAIFEAVLAGLAALHEENLVHTGMVH